MARRRWPVALRVGVVSGVFAAMLAGCGLYQLVQPISAGGSAGAGRVERAAGGQQAQAGALERHVRTLAVTYADRHHGNAARLDGAARYIQEQFEALGLPVQPQAYGVEGRAYRNLIVRLGPDTPDVLVVGAHYDVAGEQPGADDNASGVAGLIELARLLRSRPLRQRVELVAYSTEEMPYFRTEHMGSAVHARSIKASGKRVSLMLALECIGYFSDAPGSQDYPVGLLKLLYPDAGDFIGLVGFWADGGVIRRVKSHMQPAMALPLHSISAPAFLKGVDFSDHLNYAQEGFPAMMVTDTAFFRNKAYHTPEDTPERLDYGRMAQVVDGVYAAVAAEAGARDRP